MIDYSEAIISEVLFKNESDSLKFNFTGFNRFIYICFSYFSLSSKSYSKINYSSSSF